MNQILENKKSKTFHKKAYIIQFIVSICLILSFFVYLIHQGYNNLQNQSISSIAIKSYDILRLYSDNTNNILMNNNQHIKILGTISIPKINVKYPILSNYSDELLKISVCKFCGPEINHIGNFCILGHNYNSDDFFGNIHLLQNGDIIKIYDNNSFAIDYIVYSSYEVYPNDLSYICSNSRQKRNYINYM